MARKDYMHHIAHLYTFPDQRRFEDVACGSHPTLKLAPSAH